MKITMAEIRAAKSYLSRRKIAVDDISPKWFAITAKKWNMGFSDTLTRWRDIEQQG